MDRIDIRFENVFKTPVTETDLEIFILYQNISYFGYLVRNHEIRDENTLKYYVPLLNNRLITVEGP